MLAYLLPNGLSTTHSGRSLLEYRVPREMMLSLRLSVFILFIPVEIHSVIKVLLQTKHTFPRHTAPLAQLGRIWSITHLRLDYSVNPTNDEELLCGMMIRVSAQG